VVSRVIRYAHIISDRPQYFKVDGIVLHCAILEWYPKVCMQRGSDRFLTQVCQHRAVRKNKGLSTHSHKIHFVLCNPHCLSQGEPTMKTICMTHRP
jgi:hypothetical protein